jgi:hypothetical protein
VDLVEKTKKAEMVRRNTLVKWVRERSEVYELMSKTNSDPAYLEGFSYMLNKLCDDFNITPDEIQK